MRRLMFIVYAFFIVLKRQLTSKDTKKRQKASKNTEKRQLMKI
jgi:hypothetical protein